MPLAQELFPDLLGVRPESITETMGKLRRDGPKLEEWICECDDTVKAEYARLLLHA